MIPCNSYVYLHIGNNFYKICIAVQEHMGSLSAVTKLSVFSKPLSYYCVS